MKSYQKAASYAKQRGITDTSLPGWGFQPTPRQKKRLQRTHNVDMRLIMRKALN